MGVCAREKRENREMRNFLENHSMLINPPLEHLARRSLVAVRKYRNPIRSYGYGENTLYGRVFSVSVLKTGTFPLGQPTIYIGKRSELIGAALNFNLDSVEGIIRCTVLPPLFHPVLPYSRTAYKANCCSDCVVVAVKHSRRSKALTISPSIMNS